MPVIIDAPVRVGLLDIAGKPATVYGTDAVLGEPAPSFTVVKDGWISAQPIEENHGKVQILAAVPSVDTDTCDRETRRFNQEASALSEDIVIHVISTDFPFAQKPGARQQALNASNCFPMYWKQTLRSNMVCSSRNGVTCGARFLSWTAAALCAMPRTCPRLVWNRIMTR